MQDFRMGKGLLNKFSPTKNNTWNLNNPTKDNVISDPMEALDNKSRVLNRQEKPYGMGTKEAGYN